MNCGELEVLVHALIDGELDAGHAREVEVHTTVCSACVARNLPRFAPCARP
jgi:anti-sigma factor RsiW